MKPVIDIENVSKMYRLGTARTGPYRTLRETIGSGLARPWRRLRKAAARVAGRRPPMSDGPAPDRIWALKDVSFAVEPGEVVGIIGRNGAGKSTLLKVLSRITEPTSGSARLRGRVGSLLEVGTGFHAELTGRENIFLNGAILGMTRREIARKFDEIVAFSEVEQFLDTPVKHYSSGMYVRLAFAVAAHLDPEILIVDEVLAVGDLEFQKKCLGRMGSIARSGRTVLFVSHNLQTVQNLCHKAVLLSRGRVRRAGGCREVLDDYLREACSSSPDRATLASHRKPGMLPIIRDVSVVNGDGEESEYFFAGSALTFRIRYDSPVPLTNPVFGIQVETMTGEKLIYLQTLSQHGPMATLPQRGEVHCHVPSLPLMPGDYLLNFYCSDLHQKGELDALEQALPLYVAVADYFGTGQLPLPGTGRFLVRASWNFFGAPAPHEMA